MAIRHVREYHAQICSQVERMQKILEEINDYSTKNMVSSANLDALQKQLNVLKVNKARIDYILFLLDMPNKKEKEKKYIKMNKKRLSSLEPDAEIKENEKALSSLREFTGE